MYPAFWWSKLLATMRDSRVPVRKNGPALNGRFFHSGFEHAVKLFFHFPLIGRLGGIVVAGRWEMYGPPLVCKQISKLGWMVCANVSGLFVKHALLATMKSAHICPTK